MNGLISARGTGRRLLLGAMLATIQLGVAGCEAAAPEASRMGPAPDARLRTHAVREQPPTAAGLAYLDSIGELYRRVEKTDDTQRQVDLLHEALALAVPAGLPEAEVVRLDLTTRLSETLARTPAGEGSAMDLLVAELGPTRSLPVHRSSARALVALGDLARETGDDALAASSYARAIRMMSLLRQELER